MLEYDDVMNTQRNIIYGQRREVLYDDNIKDVVLKLASGKIEEVVSSFFSDANSIDDINFEDVNLMLKNEFFVDNMLAKEDIDVLDDENIIKILSKKVEELYDTRHEVAKKMVRKRC